MARLSYTRPRVRRDCHLYAYKTRVSTRKRVATAAHLSAASPRSFRSVCETSPLSLDVYSPVWQIAVRDGSKTQESPGSKLSSLLSPGSPPTSCKILPRENRLCPWHSWTILTRGSHYFSRSSRVLTHSSLSSSRPRSHIGDPTYFRLCILFLFSHQWTLLRSSTIICTFILYMRASHAVYTVKRTCLIH